MPSDQATTQLPLSAYLLRLGFSPASIWTETATPHLQLFQWQGDGRWDLLDEFGDDIFDAAVFGDVFLGLLSRTSTPPLWQKVLHDQLRVPGSFEARTSESAAIFCGVNGQRNDEAEPYWVAWTFGGASRSLQRAGIEPRFGMLAALNLMAVESVAEDPPLLRELRFRTTGMYGHQSGNKARRNIPVEGFRVDQASDLVSAVGGRDIQGVLSTKAVLGSKSLNFQAGVSSLDDISTFSELALKWSRMDHYKKVYDWIDNIRLVEDEDDIGRLRAQVAAELVEDPSRPTIDALIPDDLLEDDAGHTIQYIAFPRKKAGVANDIVLTTAGLARTIRDAGGASLSDGLDQNVRFLDGERQRVATATVLECISAELQMGSRHFIAHDGDFYEVRREYISAINARIASIPASTVPLPQYTGGTEPAYNKAVAKDHPAKFVLLDTGLLMMPGEPYGVEPCDLVSADGSLIHVKRKGRSKTFSHLLLQAVHSCELLRKSPSVKGQLQSLIAEQARSRKIVESISNAHKNFDRGSIEVVFAILGNWKGKSTTDLPLFSKIGLASQADQIRMLGFLPTTWPVGGVDKT